VLLLLSVVFLLSRILCSSSGLLNQNFDVPTLSCRAAIIRGFFGLLGVFDILDCGVSLSGATSHLYAFLSAVRDSISVLFLAARYTHKHTHTYIHTYTHTHTHIHTERATHTHSFI